MFQARIIYKMFSIRFGSLGRIELAKLVMTQKKNKINCVLAKLNVKAVQLFLIAE